MPPINRFAPTRVATRVKTSSSENFPGRNTALYTKRKAEHSPPKTKSTKRPALNDLTNDGKTAKVKSIVRNDKSVTAIKGKYVEKSEDAFKLKSSCTINGLRLPPIRETVTIKSVNETKATIRKSIETNRKFASKSSTQGTKLKTQTTKIVQTKLTDQAGIVLRRSSRVRNENEISRSETTIEEERIKLTITRDSLRNRESTVKENLEPSVVLHKLDLAVHKTTDKSSTAEDGTRPTRRSSARLSLRKSLTADKSLESNSLYVSALEDISSTKKEDKKCEWYELTEFDQELVHDPHQVSIYAAEIFHYLRAREAHFRITDYMSRLNGISKDMRTILVDWMVEVQENFELNHETLYLSVKIVDAYLDRIDEIKKDKLQLVGVSAMFVACKYDERLSPLLDDFVYVCDGAYEPKDILAMEQRLLDTLKYELSFPISYSFLRRYARCARVPMPLLTLARYILELSLMDYSTVTLSDSKQAAAALYLAFIMVKHSNWTESLASYTGYKLNDFKDIVFLFNAILRKKFPEEVHAVKTKYAHEIFFQVSKTRLVNDEELKSNMAEHS